MSDKELSVSMPASTGRANQWSPADQGAGGNLSGTDDFSLVADMVPDFQGQSGQGNNQSTDRPKGST